MDTDWYSLYKTEKQKYNLLQRSIITNRDNHEPLSNNILHGGMKTDNDKQQLIKSDNKVNVNLVTWNILADVVAYKPIDMTNFMSFSPINIMHDDVRTPKIIEQIKQYMDQHCIICLQEVGHRSQLSALRLAFSQNNYDHIFKMRNKTKKGKDSHGILIAWPNNIFDLDYHSEKNISDVWKELTGYDNKSNDNKSNDNMIKIIKLEKQNVYYKKQDRTGNIHYEGIYDEILVFQIVELVHISTRKRLHVCNTHLIANPELNDTVKLLQTITVIKSLQNLNPTNYIFCGDLNSKVGEIVHNSITNGITNQIETTDKQNIFNIELNVTTNKMTPIFNEINSISTLMCGKYINDPFKGQIDHIFIGPNIECVGKKELPKINDLSDINPIPFVGIDDTGLKQNPYNSRMMRSLPTSKSNITFTSILQNFPIECSDHLPLEATIRY